MPRDPHAVRGGGEKEIKDTVQTLNIKTFRKLEIHFRRLHPKTFIPMLKHFIPQEGQKKWNGNQENSM